MSEGGGKALRGGKSFEREKKKKVRPSHWLGNIRCAKSLDIQAGGRKSLFLGDRLSLLSFTLLSSFLQQAARGPFFLLLYAHAQEPVHSKLIVSLSSLPLYLFVSVLVSPVLASVSLSLARCRASDESTRTQWIHRSTLIN